MIGEFLYQLTPRDGAQPLLEAHIEAIFGASANVIVTCDHAVEQGYFWLLDMVTIVGQPGHATAKCVGLSAVLQPPGAADSYRLVQGLSDGAAAVSRSGNLETLDSPGNQTQTAWRVFNKLLVPPGWNVHVSANFNNALGTNVVRLEIMGIRLPRGNVAI